jgi:hypothetical protein
MNLKPRDMFKVSEQERQAIQVKLSQEHSAGAD